MFNTEKYSIMYVVLMSFIVSLFVTFEGISLYFLFIEKVEFNPTIIILFSCIFIAIFLIFFLVLLLTRKSYQYYFKDGTIIFENKGKIIRFDFSKITQIYSSNSLFYKGVEIKQTKPYQKVLFILNKDNEFINFIKKEIDIYKNSIANVEINIRYMENSFSARYASFLVLFQVVGMINTVYLDYLDNSVNIIISLICFVGLLVLVIKMIKSNRNIKRQS